MLTLFVPFRASLARERCLRLSILQHRAALVEGRQEGGEGGPARRGRVRTRTRACARARTPASVSWMDGEVGRSDRWLDRWMHVRDHGPKEAPANGIWTPQIMTHLIKLECTSLADKHSNPESLNPKTLEPQPPWALTSGRRRPRRPGRRRGQARRASKYNLPPLIISPS